MAEKKLPFSRRSWTKCCKNILPLSFVYDEAAIRANVKRLLAAFSWAPDFKEYFAVKATPNPFLLKILKEEGLGADCSSAAELILAEKVGIIGENIMFSSNDTPAEEYAKAVELGAIINLDDISHIEYLEKHVGPPELLSFRYNPGSARAGNTIIGKPEDAKYGLTKEQLFEAYRIVRDKGVKRFGIHTMVISNELNPDYFIETARMMMTLVKEIYETLGIRIEMINFGGRYRRSVSPGRQPSGFEYVGAGIRKLYEEIIVPAGLAPLKLALECGRMIAGPYGYLVSKVLHKKETYKTM